MAFPNKSILNHESVSLDWQRRASRLRQTVLNRVDARDSTQGRRGNGQKKQLNVAKLLTCSGLQVQVSFICNMLVLSLLTYLSIKQLAPVRLSLAPHYYHQSEYCAKGHHYRLESYINKCSRQIFTWI